MDKSNCVCALSSLMRLLDERDRGDGVFSDGTKRDRGEKNNEFAEWAANMRSKKDRLNHSSGTVGVATEYCLI